MTSNKHGGAEAFFTRLTQAFAQQSGLEQAVLLRHNSPQWRNLQAETRCFSHSFYSNWDFLSRVKTQKLLTRWAPNIVLTWMNRATSLLKYQKPTRSYCHIARLGGYYNLKYYRHCDHWVGNTRGITDYLVQSGLPAQRVHHIGNFVTETPGKKLTRPKTPLILAMGRLHQNKAFDVLITALAKLPDATLWLAGDGPERSALAQLADALNVRKRLHFLGWHPNPEDLLATADVFVCPSRHEPLGNVILEAWAQQKPIVATRNQGATELITPEENGLLTPLEDANALADGIQTLLTQPTAANKLAEAGFNAYHQRSSRQIITQQYLELFQTVRP